MILNTVSITGHNVTFWKLEKQDWMSTNSPQASIRPDITRRKVH